MGGDSQPAGKVEELNEEERCAAKRIEQLKRFRVEVLISPGVQIGAPQPSQESSATAESGARCEVNAVSAPVEPVSSSTQSLPLIELACPHPDTVQVAPLLVMTAACTLDELEGYL